MEQPLFSVLIANYNNGQYLRTALKSVYEQSYKNWEIVIVDDGSTDDSEEIYKELDNNPRIHIYRNPNNCGCGYTKRRCSELAQGELCGFLDPDDMLLPQALQLHAEAHVAHPNVAVVYSKAHYCDAEFNVVMETEPMPDFSNGKTYFDYRWQGCMHLTTYKKSYYDKTEGINPNAAAGVDQDLYFLLEEVGEIFALDEFCYNYVISGHPNSIATSEKNYIRLWYWNLEARYRAAKRRGLNADAIISSDMQIVFDNYVKMQVRKAEVDKELEIRSSYAYRIGKAVTTTASYLLKPFSKLFK